MDWQPVILSLKVSAMALGFVSVLGVLSAFFLVKRHFPGKDLIETLITLPLVLPPVATGFILLFIIGRQGPIGQLLDRLFHTQIVFTQFAAVLAAVIVSFPLMYQSAKGALQSVDSHLEDVARTLGSGELKVFLTVTLPLAWPGMLTGIVLSFARALGEFGATAMVAGNIPGKTQTIPIAVYFAAQSNDLSTAGVYVLIISGLTFTMTFFVNRWARRKNNLYRRRGEEHARSENRQKVFGLFPQS